MLNSFSIQQRLRRRTMSARIGLGLQIAGKSLFLVLCHRLYPNSSTHRTVSNFTQNDPGGARHPRPRIIGVSFAHQGKPNTTLRLACLYLSPLGPQNLLALLLHAPRRGREPNGAQDIHWVCFLRCHFPRYIRGHSSKVPADIEELADQSGPWKHVPACCL